MEGMFSFVPAMVADDLDARFARPPIQAQYIKGWNRQSTWGSKRDLSIDQVATEWKTVRDQVLAQGLRVATHIQTPERQTGSVVVPENDWTKC